MRKASEMLKSAREEKGLTLATVEKATKIKRIYLEEIENGAYDKLPSESYAQGFVKNYGKFLGIREQLIVPVFRREYESKKHISIIPEFRKKQHLFNKKTLFSGKGLIIISVCIIIASYIFFQYSSLLFPPGLTISSPKSNSTITGNVVEVKGKTDPYATVSVNGEEVYVALDGTFRKSVYQFSGTNKIKVVSKNRFGKQSEKIISVKVE